MQGVDIFANSVYADVVHTEDDSRHVLLGLCRQCYRGIVTVTQLAHDMT